MGALVVHPAMPMLRRTERSLANLISGGLDQLSTSGEEVSGLILQLREAGLEQVAAALERAQAAEDRAGRASNILRAFAALGVVRSRLADGVSADLTQAPLLSENSRLYIPPLPAGANPERLDGALTLLASQDTLHRLYAAERIPQWGDEALPRLLALIQKPKQEAGIKRLAARCICQMTTPAAGEALVRITDVLDAWREINNELIRRGQAVVAPLQQALSNPSNDGAWLMAKVLWRLDAKDALQKAYVAARTPKIVLATPEASSNQDKKGKAKKAEAPKPPEVHKAFEAYHTAITLTQEKVTETASKRKYYIDETERTIIMLLGLEQNWVSEDEFITMLDNQQRNELRISLRHVYGSPAHELALDHFTRMQRTASKNDDVRRARIGVSTLGETSLEMIELAEEEDE